MRSRPIVMLDILSQHPFEMALAANQDRVQAFGSFGEHPALGKRVSLGARNGVRSRCQERVAGLEVYTRLHI